MTDRSGADLYRDIAGRIETAVRGKSRAVRWLLAAFVSGGHVLLEDYPGTGKTTLAKALSRSIALNYKRIQFTPDLLPSDILGVSTFDPATRRFHFHKGPIFTNILLADEINRASPRTQSALLEAMAEFQVSIDGNRYPMDDLFFVIATQNPVEFRGTYPLPEAQMDRFAMQFSLGYVDIEEEMAILEDYRTGKPVEEIRSCADLGEVLRLKRMAASVPVSDTLKRYMVEIVQATRTAEGVDLGAGPRASLALMKIAQALALFDEAGFVTPDHIQEVAVPVIAHRLAMAPQARFSGRTAEAVVETILETMPVPA